MLKPIGKGKAIRPSWTGAFAAAPLGAAPLGGGLPGQEVYLAPGAPEGVSRNELSALPFHRQTLVMEAWFRANYRPRREQSPSRAVDPFREMLAEFGGLVQARRVRELAEALASEAPQWVAHGALDQAAAAARLGVVIAPDSLRRLPDADLRRDVLERLDAVERALAKLQPQHGGIGHNNPPDGPLTAEQLAEAAAAVTDLRQEARSAKADASRVQRAKEVLANATAAVVRWILKRAEIAADEVIKKAAAASGIFGAAEVMDAWQKLSGLVEAVTGWLAQLGG